MIASLVDRSRQPTGRFGVYKRVYRSIRADARVDELSKCLYVSTLQPFSRYARSQIATYCIRACRDGPNAAGWCQHIYDVLGCWAIPGSFESGFDTCEAAVIEAPGVYGGSTFYQGDASTPAAHAPGATSKCTSYSTVGGATITGNALPSQTGPTASGSVLASVSGSASLSMSGSPSASASASASMSGSASGSASGPSRQSSMSSPSATASSRSPSASAAPAGQSSAAADKRAVAGLSVFGGVLAALFV